LQPVWRKAYKKGNYKGRERRAGRAARARYAWPAAHMTQQLEENIRIKHIQNRRARAYMKERNKKYIILDYTISYYLAVAFLL
jgi:hypothetical protein